jgi:hypothetical protein
LSAISSSTRVSPTWWYTPTLPSSLKMILFLRGPTARFPKDLNGGVLLKYGIKATNALPTCLPLPKVKSSHPPRLM